MFVLPGKMLPEGGVTQGRTPEPASRREECQEMSGCGELRQERQAAEKSE